MSNVFVSYKREDEVRVGQLVRALERHGLSVWWDRGLAGGENWRHQIQSALDAAKCVIVVWTHESVSAAGDFVRDEAGQAKSRGVLVPVMLDRVAPPLGFGEIQAIDLTGWKGNPRDPFVIDLCAAVAAKLEGRAVPQAKGPMKRLARQLTYSGLVSAIGFAGVAFGLNIVGVQDRLCRAPLFQPLISDTCAVLSLGHRPTKAERIAWAGRVPGNCAELRVHIERFPGGAYREIAADMLAARQVRQTEVWTRSKRHLALFVGQEGVASRNESAARAAALAGAHAFADHLCNGFAATMSFRLMSAMPAAEIWHCGPASGGVKCGFDGEAICDLKERSIQEDETCGI